MSYELNGREVDLDCVLEDGEPYVMAGVYADTGKDLTDDECDEACGQNFEEIAADLWGSAVDRAHDMADMER